MAFIKKNYRKGHCYYSIVEGYREEGKVKHRTLLYLGRLDNLTEEKGRRIEAAVKGIPLEKRPGIEECIDSLAVCNVKNYGEVDLLYRIAERIDLRNIINRHVIKSGGVDVGTQMIILAINRCLDAVALQNVGLWYHHTTLEERLGIPFHELSTENLCKAMDYIYEPLRNEEGSVIDAKDNALPIKRDIVKRYKELFGIRLDTLFYDITSTYFEGDNCLIARLGYSRDGKRDKKQIVVGVSEAQPGKHGRKPSQSRVLLPDKPLKVSGIARLEDTNWRRIRVRDTERGVLNDEFAARRVWTIHEDEPVQEWVVMRVPV